MNARTFGDTMPPPANTALKSYSGPVQPASTRRSMPDSTKGLAITSLLSIRPSPATSMVFNAAGSLATSAGLTVNSCISPPASASVQLKRLLWLCALRTASVRWNCSSLGWRGSP
ncbi:hypothetical protein D3C81_1163450 [compost metagenome]